MSDSTTVKLNTIVSAVISLTSSLYDPICFALISKDELRDAMSSGQLISKQWLLDKLYLIPDDNYNVAVVGGWVGLMARAIAIHNTNMTVDSIDIIDSCTTIARQTLSNTKGKAITSDMYQFDYSPYTCVVNTAAEHIAEIRSWVDLMSPGTYIIVQSNNARHIADHINCVDSAEELKEQLNLSEVYFCDELVFTMYTRYMVIGKK